MEYMIRDVPVWLCYQRGIIHDQRQWSETVLTSYGSTGYISSRNSENIPFPQVQSFTRRYQTFWLVSENGKETQVSNAYFPCRNGQEAILIWGGRKGKNAGRQLLIYNTSTRGRTEFKLNMILFREEYIKICLREGIIYGLLFILIPYIVSLFSHIDTTMLSFSILCFGMFRVLYVMFRERRLNSSRVTQFLHEVLIKEGV